MLESPTLIFLGLVGGMLLGSLSIRDVEKSPNSLLFITVGAGALLGVALGELRRIGPALWRFATGTGCRLQPRRRGALLHRMNDDNSIDIEFGGS